jgi:microcystin-dependent protein
MSQPYIGEIRMFAGNFAPAGWAFCNGQLMPISENDALFTLIGTTYGGDGQETFAMPDLRGRLPMHQGNGVILAEAAGVETVTLTVQQIPLHNHGAGCKNGPGNNSNPLSAVPAVNTTALAYGAVPPQQTMAATMLQGTGGSQPHDNLQPYLCINFIISLFGIFPHQ